jgi:hypothetical protein
VQSSGPGVPLCFDEQHRSGRQPALAPSISPTTLSGSGSRLQQHHSPIILVSFPLQTLFIHDTPDKDLCDSYSVHRLYLYCTSFPSFKSRAPGGNINDNVKSVLHIPNNVFNHHLGSSTSRIAWFLTNQIPSDLLPRHLGSSRGI